MCPSAGPSRGTNHGRQRRWPPTPTEGERHRKGCPIPEPSATNRSGGTRVARRRPRSRCGPVRRLQPSRRSPLPIRRHRLQKAGPRRWTLEDSRWSRGRSGRDRLSRSKSTTVVAGGSARWVKRPGGDALGIGIEPGSSPPSIPMPMPIPTRAERSAAPGQQGTDARASNLKLETSNSLPLLTHRNSAMARASARVPVAACPCAWRGRKPGRGRACRRRRISTRDGRNRIR